LDQGVYASLRYDDVDGTDAFDVSKGEIELRMMIPEAVKFVNNWIPGWENAILVNASPILGVQDTRIIKGEYTLTEDDILNSKRFSDVIAVGGAKIDDWDSYKMIYPKGNYDVPYRCLLPLEVHNLFIGGRSISATRKAMMSVRCMSMCTATGHASGTAAALCAKDNILPKDLDIETLHNYLLDQGVYLGENTTRNKI